MTAVAKWMNTEEEVVRFYICLIRLCNVCRMDQFSTGIRVTRFASPSCGSVQRGAVFSWASVPVYEGHRSWFTLTVKFFTVSPLHRTIEWRFRCEFLAQMPSDSSIVRFLESRIELQYICQVLHVFINQAIFYFQIKNATAEVTSSRCWKFSRKYDRKVKIELDSRGRYLFVNTQFARRKGWNTVIIKKSFVVQLNALSFHNSYLFS